MHATGSRRMQRIPSSHVPRAPVQDVHLLTIRAGDAGAASDLERRPSGADPAMFSATPRGAATPKRPRVHGDHDDPLVGRPAQQPRRAASRRRLPRARAGAAQRAASRPP